MTAPLRLYGLTGGIGAGKSEAARRFAFHGIPVIDADGIGHELIAPGGGAETAVREAFGPAILTEQVIDREKLGALAFADAEARNRLNTILHPAIRAEIARRCAELHEAGHSIVIVEAALLAEDVKRPEGFAGLIVVTANPNTRIERLAAHRGMSREDAARRIAAQSPPEKKLAVADWVIDNEGELQDMHAQVDAVVETLRGKAGEA